MSWGCRPIVGVHTGGTVEEQAWFLFFQTAFAVGDNEEIGTPSRSRLPGGVPHRRIARDTIAFDTIFLRFRKSAEGGRGDRLGLIPQPDPDCVREWGAGLCGLTADEDFAWGLRGRGWPSACL